MQLTFPAWCSVLDRSVIQAALDVACPTQIFTPDTGRLSPPPLSESVAVESAVLVAQAVASRLPVPFPDSHRRDLDHLLAQIIVAVAARRQSPASPLPTFEAKVRDALATWRAPWSPWSRRAPHDVAQRKAAREQAVLPLLAELDWTPSQWAVKAGVSPHVTLDYLDRTTTLHRTTRKTITYAFANALKQPALRLPD